MSEPRALLRALLDAALARVAGGAVVGAAISHEGGGLRLAGQPIAAGEGLRVLALGKAAVPMARALVDAAGDRVRAGLAVTKPGHGGPLEGIAVREAGHPVPDGRSEAAGAEVLAFAEASGPDDVLVVLLSGGASALVAAPLPGLTRDDLAATTAALLACGADIGELNTVRKHLTAVSGGRLARRSGAARVLVLALSDVAGDDPAVIGSGPCAPDPTRHADALAVLERHGVAGEVPGRVRAHLEAGAAGELEESAKPGDPAFARVVSRVLATNRDACQAAAAAARERGIAAEILEPELAGEARRVGERLAARARRSPGPERVWIAGGETTVTLRGDGRGGRSQELALAAALALEGDGRITLLAAGTDGSDGPTQAAGAFADGGSVARGRERGVEARDCLARNDSHGFFAREGGLLVTGPTGTNVRDLVLVHAA